MTIPSQKKQVEELAKELKKVSVKWSDLNTGYFDWLAMSNYVLGLIIQARIHECKQFMTLNPINASYRRLTQNKIEELEEQLQTLNPTPGEIA